jgi:hypothetical protein
MTHRTIADRLVVAGSAGFIVVLALAAYWDHSIIWLHAVRALMYVATILLVLRQDRWGYFLGISIAAFWNYTNLFVTTFFQDGVRQFETLLRTGILPQPDLFISVPAVFFHFVMIAAGLWAYARVADKRASDALRFAVAFFGSIAFFAGDMALTQPRYLPIFGLLFSPHLHI